MVPGAYEGLESSPSIFYTVATTNQRIVPALDHLKQDGKKKIFLVGSWSSSIWSWRCGSPTGS